MGWGRLPVEEAVSATPLGVGWRGSPPQALVAQDGGIGVCSRRRWDAEPLVGAGRANFSGALWYESVDMKARVQE